MDELNSPNSEIFSISHHDSKSAELPVGFLYLVENLPTDKKVWYSLSMKILNNWSKIKTK